MVSETLAKALKTIREDAPPALHPVLDAFMDESDDAPEEAWQNVLRETLDEG
jgi:hypothetical protein